MRQAMEASNLKTLRPEGAKANAQILQDAPRRLDTACQSLYRRTQAGEKLGRPRFQGGGRYRSFTYPRCGGAALDGGARALSKIGGIRVPVHRLFEGNPKTVR